MFASKIWGVVLLSAVGLSVSYIVVGLYVDKFPRYAYTRNLFPYRQLKPGTASAPKLHILPIGPVVPSTAPEDAAARGKPPAPATPAPLPAREAVPTPRDKLPAPATPAPLSAREATPAYDKPPASPTPAPLSAHEAAPTIAPRASTPAVAPPDAAASPPRDAHQRLSQPPPPGRPKYRVQAGAFTQHENAEVLIRQLQANGYTATLAPGRLLRVLVGPAMSRPAAARLATELRSKGFDAFLSPAQ